MVLTSGFTPSFQYLEEDPRTNRIDDSLQLFTQICSNALLKNVHLVLFLSVCSPHPWPHSVNQSVLYLFFLRQIKPIFWEQNLTQVLKFENSSFSTLSKFELSSTCRTSITSFGERSNDYETVVQYFRAHFLQVHRRNNENRRVLYTHFTSVVVRLWFPNL